MPQARGVKCDLCKEILTLATWIDQTKLAKNVSDAEVVLTKINQHNDSSCPCIPKNIENLLVGSTHFEIHRLLIGELDSQVHDHQTTLSHEQIRTTLEASKNLNVINDCCDTKKGSRFKYASEYFENEQLSKSKQQLYHLKRAIDFWSTAMYDTANPFNSKLALRLGLTHHVVYASYLFKLYKISKYQLKTSVLLLDLFKSIEGVTDNAILHANYILIRSLIDSSQPTLARQYLKHATKMPNYHDKSNYESILLTCAACELRLTDESETDKLSILEDLKDLLPIRKDDKLQHYYARTLAMSTVIRYIQYYRSKTDQCFEFFHIFRFVCAIIRRCYETSFDLVLSIKDTKRQRVDANRASASKVSQILDHNWIRFAISDFSFSSFEIILEFYRRAGMPECLEILYNGLALIAFRSGSIYWQSRMGFIGIELDLLCDKIDDAKLKLAAVRAIIDNHHNDDGHDSLSTIDLLGAEFDIISAALEAGRVSQKTHDDNDLTVRILEKLRDSAQKRVDEIQGLKIHDHMIGHEHRCGFPLPIHDPLHLRLALSVIKLNGPPSRELLLSIAQQLRALKNTTLEFYSEQSLLEVLLSYVGVKTSERRLLESVNSSQLFLKMNSIRSLSGLLSNLDLNNGDADGKLKRVASSRNKTFRKPLKRQSKRKGVYQVAIRAEENLPSQEKQPARAYSPVELIENFPSISEANIVLSYVRYSEPNPDYLLVRKAHEIMLCLRLSETELPGRNARYNVLYHFTESINCNTIRYRWMMFQELQDSPFDPTSGANVENANNSKQRYTSFSYTADPDRYIKSMVKLIPNDIRLCQLKYIHEPGEDYESLLICCFDSSNEPIFIHTTRSLVSDDFFVDANTEVDALTIPNRMQAKIEDFRGTLFEKNSRLEMRQNLEAEMELILQDFERELLGPFKFILCARSCEDSFKKMVRDFINDLPECSSPSALRMLLEGVSSLSRDQFLDAVSLLYHKGTDWSKNVVNDWTKRFDKYMKEHHPGADKTVLMRKFPGKQIGLILDQRLEHIPFESLRVVRTISQGIFRTPSLRIFGTLIQRHNFPIGIDSDRVAYVLDPANNLAKTRARFESKLSDNKDWPGVIGQSPRVEQLETWLCKEDLYIYIGHGAGTAYYNKLERGRGLNALREINAAALVMGCSSGRMVAEGPMLESFGIGWVFIARGAPCYVGLLWDVTDTEIDKYLDSLLARWIPSKWPPPNGLNGLDSRFSAPSTPRYITDMSSKARHDCKLMFLVGSTPVVYGLPIFCRDS